jgi:hypothetical protein
MEIETAKDCAYLSQFTVHARYPFEMTTSDLNTEKALKISEKIIIFPPITELREKLTVN